MVRMVNNKIDALPQLLSSLSWRSLFSQKLRTDGTLRITPRSTRNARISATGPPAPPPRQTTRSREPASPGRPRSREKVTLPINNDIRPGRTISLGTPRSTVILHIQRGRIRIQTRVVVVVVAPSARRPRHRCCCRRRCRPRCRRRVARQWWRPTVTTMARHV